MKRIILLILILSSCTTEIDLYDDAYSDQLFVWGCFDGSGKLHQVKIRKAISEEASLVDLLNRPESYLPVHPLQVSLTPAGGSPVNLVPVVYPPQSGIFAEDSNLIYELRDYYPGRNQRVRLTILDSLTGKTASSDLRPLPAPQFTFPFPGSENASWRFTWEGRPFYISWTGGEVWIWSITLKYLDFLQNGDTVFRKGTFYGEPKFAEPSREFPMPYLWNIFRKVIPDDPDVKFRMFYRFDFGVWAGDGLLSRYLANKEKFNDNRRGYYWNMEGAIGLFFSVNHTVLKNVRPDDSFGNIISWTDTLSHMKFSRLIYNGKFNDPDSVAVDPFRPLFR